MTLSFLFVNQFPKLRIAAPIELVLMDSFHDVDFGGAVGRENSGDMSDNDGDEETHNNTRNGQDEFQLITRHRSHR